MWLKCKNTAFDDISNALKDISLAGLLGLHDVRQRYIRSILGPFWLTISMGVMIGTIGIVFGNIFASPKESFLPFLAVGIIVWTFIATTISEGCQAFISAEHIIKQLPVPLTTHILRVVWRNLIIFAHNLLILPFLCFLLGTPLHDSALLAIPGLVLLSFNMVWIALLLAIICTRFRDLTQIVNSVLQVFFYLTPIIWMPSLITHKHSHFILEFNPFYHFIAVVRAPLLNQYPENMNWFMMLGTSLVGWLVTLVIYSKYKDKIAYWL